MEPKSASDRQDGVCVIHLTWKRFGRGLAQNWQDAGQVYPSYCAPPNFSQPYWQEDTTCYYQGVQNV